MKAAVNEPFRKTQTLIETTAGSMYHHEWLTVPFDRVFNGSEPCFLQHTPPDDPRMCSSNRLGVGPGAVSAGK